MTVHREQSMKREDQQDAKIRCLLLTSVSTCFGHHYAHLQENKGPVTAFGVYWSGFVRCGFSSLSVYKSTKQGYTYLLAYLLTTLLHGAESFLGS